MARPPKPTAAQETLDRLLPPRGQCWICGIPGEDARHRIVDAVLEHIAAGEGPGDVAGELDLTVEAVEAVIAWAAEQRELNAAKRPRARGGESRQAPGKR